MDEIFLQRLSAVITELMCAGRTLRELGRVDDAIRCFEALAIGDATYETGAYAFELALCYEMKSDAVTSQKFAKIALRENPGLYSYSDEIKRILSSQ